ncbi:hypothetical protein GF348_24275 [candidate division KSB3 bacterium]|nr:hypothetical protein [candidate division KSB3 bacterium]
MKFKSNIVTQVSGSIGGLVGSHNQGGMYFRARSVPTNPQTAFQVAVRNAVTLLATAWQDTLTAAQREAWDTYAANVPLIDRLGEARNTTGIAHYVRSNVPRLQAGLARVDDGPTVFALPSFTEVTFAPAAATDDFDVSFDNTDAWANEDDAALLLYASRPQSATINFFKGPYRYAGRIDGDGSTAPTSPETIDSPFALTADLKQFYKAVLTRADGRLSSPFRGSGVVT